VLEGLPVEDVAQLIASLSHLVQGLGFRIKGLGFRVRGWNWVSSGGMGVRPVHREDG